MKKLIALVCSTLPIIAFAHTGGDGGGHHQNALLTGFLHPFTGVDHMAVMVAVGVWSSMCFTNARRTVLVPPVVFSVLLLTGGLLGIGGMALPLVEPMIAVSLLVLGLLVAQRIKMHIVFGAVLTGTFALFHGVAHGTELPADAAIQALAGMVIATVLLHLSGIGLGYQLLARYRWLSQLAGAGVALFGMHLLLA